MKVARRYLLAGSLVVLIAAVSSVAGAWVPLPARWATTSLPVHYRINEATVPPALGAANARAAILAGWATWSAPPCTNWRTVNDGTTTLTAARWGDGQNSILWRSGTWPPELGSVSVTIGVTTPVYRRGSPMTEADIQFNNVGFTWSLDGRTGTVDTQSIATHEQGHFLGLGHTPLTAAIMFAGYPGGVRRTLLGDDAMGVCTLYPSGATLTCMNDTMCASGQQCLMGRCQWVASDAGGTGRGLLGDPCSMTSPCSAPNSCACLTPTSCVCSRTCTTATSCPSGFRCVSVLGARLCLLAGTAILGADCDTGLDCASGICLPRAGGGFCSQTCAMPCDCPPDYDCLDRAGVTYCMPGTNRCATDSGTPADDVQPADDVTPTDDVVGMDDAAVDDASIDGAASDVARDGGPGTTRPGCRCRVPGGTPPMGRGLVAFTALGVALGLVRQRRRARST